LLPFVTGSNRAKADGRDLMSLTIGGALPISTDDQRRRLNQYRGHPRTINAVSVEKIPEGIQRSILQNLKQIDQGADV
jgi:hypothetical protein